MSADCAPAGGYQLPLTPGEKFSDCAAVAVRIPLLPDFVETNTATGHFFVEWDRYVDR